MEVVTEELHNSHRNEKYNGYCTQKRQNMQCLFLQKQKKDNKK